jgi:hypothetical protein
MPTKMIPVYFVTMKNGHHLDLKVTTFRKKFPKPGHNFETRLEQLRWFVPTAVDWELTELPPEAVTVY